MSGGPPPRHDHVVAAVATTAEVLAHPELDADMLAPWERRRLTRIRVPARRDDVVAARLLLRLCASRFTGLAPDAHDLVQFCPECGQYEHGRPSLRDRPRTGVSMSHAHGLVAAAAGPGAVGIDVEPSTRRPGPVAVLRRMLPEADLEAAAASPDPGPELLRAWVRREALLKAGGGGLPLLVWADRRRGATAAVASTVPVAVLPGITAHGGPSEG
ncbi:4'-phosphopantetheinyl transferase superfamily protein [Streptomyces laculatispora]|uniref:4'-phosphopantetheinyl transferase superfamily protein n=1 Tax=Streptomyces laculatispora TaxID=887464 RepID=A0ABY9I1D8_9ACTN|nr:4'-phosphopantetheinyl transferase superfamily protein [Streptomyces laculatispora]WLQ40653.1 4'-phosphopantetheinyl transferase superfamily protein [Streptomyces laculatispora]